MRRVFPCPEGEGHRLSADFKAWVVLDTAKSYKTASELAQEYEIHPTQITSIHWRLISASTSESRVAAE